MAHATEQDLTDWLAGSGLAVPADADRQLERASLLVDRATVAARYDPDDPDIIQALSDATCAQVEWWLASGDELGETSQWSDMAIGSARLARQAGTAADRDDGRLAARAKDVLIVSGLTPAVTVGG